MKFSGVILVNYSFYPGDNSLTSSLIDPVTAAKLLDDLRKVDSGNLDIGRIIETAPTLTEYKFVLGWCHGLKGTVHGHPSLPDGREVVTSQIFYFNPGLQLARTLNRWYRLMDPMQRDGH
ncbi:hypothetical protein [Rhizobium sp. 'Codium 1']|uniref:hypothetical protein n=1 Tax=Rhizobium sp. 'Codium 1' TaxID=2940484 RepID=UPI001E3AC282|nr:hypothetical protein [Rhizobium sp. 'Codium 1']MCC8932272.1 hypothetical protein [Rhizobium sp. 'Codium 1']